MAEYLSSLNENQREAVTHTEGPLMIIAGAGSGKTRVLTYRTAYLIQEKTIDPFRILLLTFTNKAAGEMQERIKKVVGNEAKNVWMGTFHSIFAKILRIEADKLGYTSQFSIFDTDDSKAILKTIIKEKGLDDKIYRPNVIYNRISGAKNRLIGAEQYFSTLTIQNDDRAARMPELGAIYVAYQQRLFQANAMDFDDLLYLTNVLFNSFPETLEKYQKKFQYIMVDEFQDTNLSQYMITKNLSAFHKNIAVVGDDAQSIYSFRGAEIKNILDFEKDFKNLYTIRLEQNYRSTQTIVEAANSIIHRNKQQLPKNVWTANEKGNLIELIKTGSDTEEGRMIATHIFQSKLNFGLTNDDFAILYRTNAQSRVFEESLRKMNLPYRIIGGLSFYQRKEVKDVLAYLRFIVNPKDEEAFKRIINLPKRGIGEATALKIIALAAENNCSIGEIVAHTHQFPTLGRALGAIQAFAELIEIFRVMVELGKDAYYITNEVAKSSGLLKELYDDKTVEGLSRYENIQSLLNGIKAYIDSDENPDKSLPTFLQTISLLTSADESQNAENQHKITLITIHGAKGLEFKYVYVVGMEEGLFPSGMMMDSREKLEEERRLFYVAVTRAEQQLVLSYAQTRYQFGTINSCEESRFLEEIDEEFIKKPQRFLAKKDTVTKPVRLVPKTYMSNNSPSTPSQPTVSEDFIASPIEELGVGKMVQHPKFGKGKITELQLTGSEKKATIIFKSVGTKTLMLNFAKLRVIG